MSAQDLLTELRDRELLTPDQLRAAARLAETGDARALPAALVRAGLLTRWQLAELAAGRGGELRVGQYVLLDRLGEGGMGQVFKARHVHMARVVALKLMRKDRVSSADSVQRFYQEVQAAAKLSHPNIVQAFDAGPAGTGLFLAMELVEGPDLSRLVKEKGPLPVALACEYARQAALGLAHAHERGLVHRDVKPGNLLLARGEAGEPGTVKVLDLGLARPGDPASRAKGGLTQLGQVLGTPDYIAPEQAIDARSVDHRADLYSLGCSLYYLLVGRAPFLARSVADVLVKHQLEPPPSARERRRDVPAAVDGLIQRLMAKRPEDRPRTAAEVAELLAGLPRAPATPPPPPPRRAARDASTWERLDDGARAPRPRRARRPRWLLPAAGAALAGLAVIAAGLAVALSPRGDATPEEPLAVQGSEGPLEKVKPGPEKDKSSEPPRQRVEVEEVEHRLVLEGVQAWIWGADGPPTSLPPPPPPPPKVKRVTAPVVYTFREHKGPVVGVAFLQGGKQAISLGGLSWHRHDLSAGKAVHSESMKGQGTGLSMSPYGRMGVVGASGAMVLVSFPTDKPHQRPFKDIEAGPHAVALARSGWYALSAVGGVVPDSKPERVLPHEVWLWDAMKQKVLNRFAAGATRVTDVAFSTDAKYVLASSIDRPLQVWERNSKKALPGVARGELAPGPMRLLPVDGTHCLLGLSNGPIVVWDVAKAKEVRRLEGHSANVRALAFTNGQKQLVSVAGRTTRQDGRPVDTDLTLRVWDFASGKELGKIDLPSEPISLAVSTYGAWAIVGDHSAMRVYDITRLTEKKAPQANAKPEAPPVSAFDGHRGTVTSLAVSPDGKRLLTGCADGRARLFALDTGRPVGGAGRVKDAAIQYVRFLDGGAKFVTAGEDIASEAWDARTGRPLGPAGPPVRQGGKTYSLAVSPDGTSCVVASGNMLWSMTMIDGRPGVGRGMPTKANVHCVVELKEEGHYAYGEAGGRVAVVNLPRGRDVWSHAQHAKGAARCLAYDAKGGHVISGGADRRIVVRNGKTGKLVWAKAAHEGPVTALAVSSDGKLLASASKDKTVRVWQLGTAREAHKFEDAEAVRGVAFLPGDKQVISCGKGVRTWDLPQPAGK